MRADTTVGMARLDEPLSRNGEIHAQQTISARGGALRRALRQSSPLDGSRGSQVEWIFVWRRVDSRVVNLDAQGELFVLKLRQVLAP